MDYRVLFTQRALADLSEVAGRIAQDDDEEAARFGKALLDHVDLLGRFPGRRWRPRETRMRSRRSSITRMPKYRKQHPSSAIT
jgi:plasmid stabilization system protein ParE